MRWPITALVALALAPWVNPVRAQSGGVTVELTLDENTFLPGEEIVVGVRISNLSGRPLTFGSTDHWLTFFVETKQGQVCAHLGQVPVQGEFTLESSKAGTKWWNIQPYFDFSGGGVHHVYAELRLPEWKERIISDPVALTIQSARKLWETSFGVPPAEGLTNGAPELRRYALQAANRTRDRNLYARVTDDEETRILKVVFLDRLVSFSQPQQQLDGRSQLHVLFQTGGSIYTYCIVTPDGNLAVRQRHEIVSGSRPRLAKLEDGSIEVRGGRRIPTAADIPPYEPPPPPPPTSTPEPAGTDGVGPTDGASVTNAVAGSESGQDEDSKSRRRKKRSDDR